MSSLIFSSTGASNFPSLIGKGSFGKVYSLNSNFVYKESNIIMKDKDDYIIIENNIRELIFYKYVKQKYGGKISSFSLSYFLNYLENIPIPDNYEVKNNISKIYLYNHGLPLSKYSYSNIDDFKSIFSQVCKTIYEFYINNMTHGDLKPSNILLHVEKEEPTLESEDVPKKRWFHLYEKKQSKPKKKDINISVKIIDFGSVQFNHYYKLKQSYQRCTLLYVSPEELCNDVYSKYNDWWSIGVIMFEYITGKKFIECLLKYCGVDTDIIQTFFDCMYKLKKASNFNPITFLMEVYKSIKQSHILKTVYWFIKDEELRLYVIHFLVKDPRDRISFVSNILNKLVTDLDKSDILNENSINYFKYNKRLQETMDELPVLGPVLPEEYKVINLNCYTYESRKLVIDMLYNICTTHDKFTKELFGHTVMLLDRVYFRWHSIVSMNKIEDVLEIEIVSLICLFISRLIMKSDINRVSDIIKMSNIYYKKKYENNEVIDIFNFVTHILDFNLYNVSPDLILNKYGKKVDINKIYESFIKYPIVNETSEKISTLLISI
jgi:serine/threonine protein kinase